MGILLLKSAALLTILSGMSSLKGADGRQDACENTDEIRAIPEKILGSLNPWAFQYKNGSAVAGTSTTFASPSRRLCCSKGHFVESWTTILSEPRPGVEEANGSDSGSLVLLSAKCDDGEQLAPVVAGYNNSGRTNCLLHPQPARTVPDPQDRRYNFSYGMAVDSFLSDTETHVEYASCPGEFRAVGYESASACLSLVGLKVICGRKIEASTFQIIKGSPWYIPFVSVLVAGIILAIVGVIAYLVRPGKIGNQSSSDDEMQIQLLDSDNRFSFKSIFTMGRPHAGLTAIPFSQVELVEEVVDISSLHISVENPTTFEDLPEKWLIPLPSVKLLCKEGRPLELGTGGFGMVYRAIVRKEEAAVKLLKCGRSSEQAQLLHEIKIMERCVSAYIVRFLGYSISNGLLILLMEFMPGGTLFKALEEGEAFQWYNRGRAALFDVAKGLYSIHEQGLIHYDLKSNNILLTEGGHAKIADFGLGRSINDPETIPLAVRGTVPWMAPEVLRPSGGSAGSLASDVWSFSTIIWELCLKPLLSSNIAYPSPGEQRYGEPTTAQLETLTSLLKVCTLRRPTRSISPADIKVPAQAPQELVDLMAACRAESPLARPTTGEVCDRLEQILYNQSTAE